jgi:hypothetical protein
MSCGDRTHDLRIKVRCTSHLHAPKQTLDLLFANQPELTAVAATTADLSLFKDLGGENSV